MTRSKRSTPRHGSCCWAPGADTGTLLRKEVELARHEIVASITARLRGAGALAIAGVCAVVGLVYAALAAMIALEAVVPRWPAALIVAGFFFVAAGAVTAFGLRRIKGPPLMPEETVRTVKEDVEWTRELLKR